MHFSSPTIGAVTFLSERQKARHASIRSCPNSRGGQTKTGLRNALLAVAALLACGVACAGDLPDPRLTPGAVSPEVTQQNIVQTMCVKGYTRSIRPPASFTNRLKKQQIRAYGYADRNLKHCEEDHLIALSIGGAPADPRNLWPQPHGGEWSTAREDQFEVALNRKVCNHEIALAEAQREMAADWKAAWKRFVPGARY